MATAQQSDDGIGSDSIVTKRSYWYDLGEQYDTYRRFGRYKTGK